MTPSVRGAAHTSGVKALRATTHDGVNVFEMNRISVGLGGGGREWGPEWRGKRLNSERRRKEEEEGGF